MKVSIIIICILFLFVLIVNGYINLTTINPVKQELRNITYPTYDFTQPINDTANLFNTFGNLSSELLSIIGMNKQGDVNLYLITLSNGNNNYSYFLVYVVSDEIEEYKDTIAYKIYAFDDYSSNTRILNDYIRQGYTYYMSQRPGIITLSNTTLANIHDYDGRLNVDFPLGDDGYTQYKNLTQTGTTTYTFVSFELFDMNNYFDYNFMLAG